MIAIVDYGMGNLRSVEKAFAALGLDTRVCADPDHVSRARGVVLPGVGAFGAAVRNLMERGLDRALLEAVGSGTPFLGICLGMQVLFSYGEEGDVPGLGVFRGRVPRFVGAAKVPHMGWNTLRKVGPSRLLEGIPDGRYFYFVHSYYASPEEAGVTVGVTPYAVEFTSVVERGNVYGTQFHPEKSGRWGLKLLENFGRLVLGADNTCH